MHHIEAHLMSTIDCVNYATFLPIAISQKGFSDILRLLRSTPVLSAKTPIFTAKSTTLFTPTHNFIIVSRSNCQVLLCYRALCVSFLCWYQRLRFSYIDITNGMINEMGWISLLVGSHDAEISPRTTNFDQEHSRKCSSYIYSEHSPHRVWLRPKNAYAK